MPKVLVAIDGSEHANRAFKRAVELFGPDAEYLMLSVVPPLSPMSVLRIGAGTPSGISTHGHAGTGNPLSPTPEGIEKMAQGVYDHFREAQSQAQRIAGVRATGLIEEAKSSKRKVGQMVVDVAAEQGADAIVVGAHGSSFVGGALLGSVSQHVIHNAHCPVVVSRDND